MLLKESKERPKISVFSSELYDKSSPSRDLFSLQSRVCSFVFFDTSSVVRLLFAQSSVTSAGLFDTSSELKP